MRQGQCHDRATPAGKVALADHVKSHLDFRRPPGIWIGADRSNEIPVALCPTCNHDAVIGARFCSRCGTVLPRRVCRTCGTANEVEALRCIECGEALRQAAPSAAPAQAEEDSIPHDLGPMARLAELNARLSMQAPAPRAPFAAALAPPTERIAAIAPTQDEPATRSATFDAGVAGGANLASGAISAGSPGIANAVAPLAPVAEDEAEAVDLYLELPRASVAPAGAPAHGGAVPGASAPGDAPAEWTPSEAAVSAAAQHGQTRLGPFAIGAAVLAFGVAVAGGAWLWQRSAQGPQPPTSTVRPPADRLPARLGTPAKDDPDRAAQPPPARTAPMPAQAAAQPPERGGASSAVPRRGDGVDAAADAALAAAERALATQGRPASPGASPATRPRPSAAPASGPGTSP